MAHEFGRRGVRANAIAPGEIETSILSPGTDALVAAEVPMGRLGEPREVAETIHFLCTEQSSYINGAEIHINGGQHV
jgi:NAD(P)-dependent dehydrogenase (short-subunit alcohol dehydrogenase family)